MKHQIVSSELINYCTSHLQETVVKSMLETQSYSQTGAELGMSFEAVRSHVRRAKSRAAVHGFSPENDLTKPVPASHVMKGASTLYDAAGNVKMQWVKSDKKKEDLTEFLEALTADLPNRIEPTEPTPTCSSCSQNLMNVIPIGDAHIGMYAAGDETGESFGLAKNVIRHQKAIEYLVASAPSAETALIINCGDFVHINDQTNRTPKSGAPLDADGRWHEIVQAARDLLIYMIKAALVTHKKVKLVSALGNHDPSTYLINLVLDSYFRTEPRVEIDTSPSKFHYHQFGKNMIMVSHSDTIKPNDAPSIMAADRPEMWGQTKYRYAHLGHFHHKQVISLDGKEHRGATVEISRTLVPQDAWHWGSGYRAMQECKLITYHKDYGEVQRINVNPDMLDN